MRVASFEQAVLEGLEGLQALEPEADPAHKEAFRRHFSRNASHLEQLRRIGAAFQESGFQAIVLKGASLLKTVYPELGARPMGDIDILVRPQDYGRALTCLRSLGYTCCDACLVGPGARVDLHQRLLGEENVRPDVSAFRFPTELLWQEAQPTEWPGILRLSPEHQVLHLCVHALKHSFHRLIWLVDIQRSLELCDSSRLLQQANYTGSGAALGYAVHLLRRFDLESSFTTVVKFNLIERGVLELVRRRKLRSGWGKLLMAMSLKGKGRWRYLYQLVFPPKSQWPEYAQGVGWLRYHGCRFARVLKI